MTAVDLVIVLVGMLGFLLCGAAWGFLLRRDGEQGQREADLAEMEKRLKDMEALYDKRRVPYGVVEQVENEQARVVNDLLNAEEALERVKAAMGRTINVYGRLLDRQPLEGNGRDRKRVARS